jgi:outer membrane assembly lipoprotein YfiO
LDYARRLVEAGRNYDAILELQKFTSENPGSGMLDRALYYLGRAYLGKRDHAMASDPTMSVRAIDQLMLFIKLHPESPFVPDARGRVTQLRVKLAEKQYLNGRLYLKLKRPAAARFYFENVLAEYGDTQWAPRCMLEIAKSYEIEKETAKAADEYNRLIQTYPDSEEAGQARLRIEELGFEVAGQSPNFAGEDAEEVSAGEDR